MRLGKLYLRDVLMDVEDNACAVVNIVDPTFLWVKSENTHHLISSFLSEPVK